MLFCCAVRRHTQVLAGICSPDRPIRRMRAPYRSSDEIGPAAVCDAPVLDRSNSCRENCAPATAPSTICAERGSAVEERWWRWMRGAARGESQCEVLRGRGQIEEDRLQPLPSGSWRVSERGPRACARLLHGIVPKGVAADVERSERAGAIQQLRQGCYNPATGGRVGAEYSAPQSQSQL